MTTVFIAAATSDSRFAREQLNSLAVKVVCLLELIITDYRSIEIDLVQQRLNFTPPKLHISHRLAIEALVDALSAL